MVVAVVVVALMAAALVDMTLAVVVVSHRTILCVYKVRFLCFMDRRNGLTYRHMEGWLDLIHRNAWTHLKMCMENDNESHFVCYVTIDCMSL